MAVQLDTSLYKQTPFDPNELVDSAMKGYKFADDARTAAVARRAAEAEEKRRAAEAGKKEEADYLDHETKLRAYMNSVKGEVARYVKAYPEEKRQAIWDKHAKKSLSEVGIDVTDMPDYDPAELDAWDLNSSGENVRSRNQIAEQKDLTSRYGTDQNNMTKLALQQLKSQNPTLKYMHGNDGYMWAYDPKDPSKRFNTGMAFDQSRSFLLQDGTGGYNIADYNPQVPFMPSAGVPPAQPAAVPQDQELPPAPTQPPAPVKPALNVTPTNIQKTQLIPDTKKTHINHAVAQSDALDSILLDLTTGAEEVKAGKPSTLQKVIKPTGPGASLINDVFGKYGPGINDAINPGTAKLRAALAQLEALALRDMSGKAVNYKEIIRNGRWIPGIADSKISTLIPKIEKMKEFYTKDLTLSAKQYSPEFGYTPDPLLEPYLGNYDEEKLQAIAAKRAEIAATKARLSGTEAVSPAPADSSNMSNLAGKRTSPSHLGTVTELPPGGFVEGDTQDGEGDNGEPAVLIFTNGRWQEKK